MTTIRPGKPINHATEQDWLEARAQYLTASEIARVYTTSAPEDSNQCWELWDEKRGVKTPFAGNRFTRFGSDREHVIADWVQTYESTSLKPNGRTLWVADCDTRFAATPDMITEDGSIIAEIKTVNAKNDWGDGDIPAGYYRQVQWQLLCTGAHHCVFVWETYEDHDGELVGNGDFRTRIIHRDDDLINDLMDFADEFFALQHKQRPTPDIGHLVEYRRDIERGIACLEAERRQVNGWITEQLAGRTGSWDWPGVGKLTVTAPTVRSRFDAAAFKKDHPELVAEYTTEKETAGTVRFTAEKGNE